MDLGQIGDLYKVVKAIEGVHDYFKERKWQKRHNRFDVNEHLTRSRVGETGFSRFGFPRPQMGTGVFLGDNSARKTLGSTNFTRTF